MTSDENDSAHDPHEPQTASSSVTVVYTDGACSGNPGPGGWAWIVPGGAFGAGPAADTTNQRMELQAVLEALTAISGPVNVISDSTYVVNCFRDSWWEGWLKRGWKNSQKKPVANRDLWEPLIDLYRARSDELEFTWVKGHSGNEWNDYADRLAVEAGYTQQRRSGNETPSYIGEPDKTSRKATPASTTSSTAPPTAGGLDAHLVAVLGHQPPEIGGYDDNPLADRLQNRLVQILRAKAELDPDLTVLSGLRLGAEQLGAEAAFVAEIPVIAVLPYPSPDKKWPKASRERFATQSERSAEIVVLQKSEPDTAAKAGAALRQRDAWLAKHAAEAIIVWDGKDPRLAKTVRAFEQALGDNVWVVDPSEV